MHVYVCKYRFMFFLRKPLLLAYLGHLCCSGFKHVCCHFAYCWSVRWNLLSYWACSSSAADVIFLQIRAKHLAQCISREERKNRNGFGEKSFTGFHPVVHTLNSNSLSSPTMQIVSDGDVPVVQWQFMHSHCRTSFFFFLFKAGWHVLFLCCPPLFFL